MAVRLELHDASRARALDGVLQPDTGVGMDVRVKERAFDDFYTTKTTGSGLGLALVRRVAEAHGATVELVSAVGRGTEVLLTLPLGSDFGY